MEGQEVLEWWKAYVQVPCIGGVLQPKKEHDTVKNYQCDLVGVGRTLLSYWNTELKGYMLCTVSCKKLALTSVMYTMLINVLQSIVAS